MLPGIVPRNPTLPMVSRVEGLHFHITHFAIAQTSLNFQLFLSSISDINKNTYAGTGLE
jgi:hypothetical protein